MNKMAFSTTSSIRLFIGCLLLPNLVFYLAGYFIYFDRALINLDYILLVFIALLTTSIAIIGFFTVIFIAMDIIVSSISIYFYKLGELLPIINNLFLLNLFTESYIEVLLIILAGLLGYIFIIKKLMPKKISITNMLILISITLIIITLDVINGTNLLKTTIGMALVDRNIAGSSSFTMTRAMLQNINSNNKPQKNELTKVEAATCDLLQAMWKNSPYPQIHGRHLVLVLVESLGLVKDQQINRSLLAPFLTPRVTERYQIQIGSVPFSGATTKAEFRELCGIKMDYMELDEARIPMSLPTYLRHLGFRTLAVHGYKGDFFRRHEWYPQIGFERSLFYNELIKEIKFRQCGSAFRCICDAYAASVIEKEILEAPANERLFAYWVTLNSHLPVHRNSVIGSPLNSVRLGPS